MESPSRSPASMALSLSLLFFFFLSGNSAVASALEVWQRMAAAKWDFRMIILNPDLQQEESLCVSRFYVTLGPRFLGWLSYFSSISWKCKFRDGISVYFLAFLLTLQEGRILLECCSGNEFWWWELLQLVCKGCFGRCIIDAFFIPRNLWWMREMIPLGWNEDYLIMCLSW